MPVAARLLPPLALLALVSGCAPAPAIATASPAPQTPAALPSRPRPGASCAVWDRENAFARSVLQHDGATFAEHVLPGAVFVDGDGVLRGRQAVVDGWSKVLRGEGLVFTWHPTSVIVTGDPHVALSRGPYWIEFTKPDAKQRFLTGTFQSVWVQDTDGAWRVAIDGGTADPKPATEAEIQKIRDAIPARCPEG